MNKAKIGVLVAETQGHPYFAYPDYVTDWAATGPLMVKEVIALWRTVDNTYFAFFGKDFGWEDEYWFGYPTVPEGDGYVYNIFEEPCGAVAADPQLAVCLAVLAKYGVPESAWREESDQ